MEAEFKSTQRFVPPLVGILLKMAKIGHFAFKDSTCIFNSINVYVPYSINDYIWANFNFQESCSIALSVLLISNSLPAIYGKPNV